MNTLFLRLEGPTQAWGVADSKFVIRRSAEAPTKSGVIGILLTCCGVDRPRARAEGFLERLAALDMAVRIDRPGVRWWDYHTVGARMSMPIAEEAEKTKPGAMLTRREYLCDASFLVALQGDAAEIESLSEAIRNPVWTPYLGRKNCPLGRPLWENVEPNPGEHQSLLDALQSVPWRRRTKGETPPGELICLIDWKSATPKEPLPLEAELWNDVPISFHPPAHRYRSVVRSKISPANILTKSALVTGAKAPPRPRANYQNKEYRQARLQRLETDEHLCVFCKEPATTVQHITYQRAGGGERHDDLRSLCRLCHDAVTMLEYGEGLTTERINPEDPHWRERILEKRNEIIQFRSLETRRRRLSPEEVE